MKNKATYTRQAAHLAISNTSIQKCQLNSMMREELKIIIITLWPVTFPDQ